MLKALKELREKNKIIFYEIPTFPWKEEAKRILIVFRIVWMFYHMANF